ncbi:Serine/threonine-protein kinase PknB [Polystyrenella longa]|uniref:non-specific serine/threonine protein kinase n=2 Tax=Polystyrenella longa TaxID=2528007 RepID=A0A518CGW1_9PLAN|nr:Serine/threonine-protein kinase PknB [Polystyrenella longa]
MSSVFLAQQKSLHRQVALKLLKPELLENEEDETYLKRFSQEAAAAAALNHPNIVQVYSIGEEQGYHYIAQEYVQGVNLRQYIDKHGPLDLKLTISLLRQIASALQKAGEIGIVHRDIKPDNILLNRKGQVKVADFGLARIVRQEDKGNLTQAGTTLGTPLYMSPEQVHGHELDQRSDIYSLGVTCYCMLSGKPPFQGTNAVTIAMKHINEKPVPLSKHRPDLPAELGRVVEKMMAKDRRKRYSDCQEILNELKRLFPKSVPSTEPVVNDWETNLEIPTATPFNWTIGKTIGVMVASALLVAGISGGIAFSQRPGDLFKLPETPPTNLKQTPSDQYLYALNQEERAEEALRALINNPAEFQGQETEYRKYQKFAQLRLAHLYLVKGLYTEAMDLFEEVKDTTNRQEEMVFFSQSRAGEIITLGLTENYTEIDRLQNAYELPKLLNRLSADEIDLLSTSLEKTAIALKKQGYYADRYPSLGLVLE